MFPTIIVSCGLAPHGINGYSPFFGHLLQPFGTMVWLFTGLTASFRYLTIIVSCDLAPHEIND
jgi:hypothetical protein